MSDEETGFKYVCLPAAHLTPRAWPLKSVADHPRVARAISSSRFWDAYKKAAEQMFDTEKEIIIDNSNMAGGEKLEEHLDEWRKVRLVYVCDSPRA